MKRVKFLLLGILIFTFSNPIYPALVTRNSAPDFLVSAWINAKTRPSLEKLRGKVILLAFWNYSSLEAKRDQYLLEEWYEHYKYQTEFTVIGVHSPEYDFEKKADVILYHVKKRELSFPIALDSEGKLQNLYRVTKNPSYFLIDAKGRLRERFDDLSNYENVEKKFVDLLLETDLTADIPKDDKIVLPNSAPVVDLKLGFRNPQNFGNLEKVQAEVIQPLKYPQNQAPEKIYADGFWKAHEQSLEFGKTGCKLKATLPGSEFYFVAGSVKKTLIPAEVRLNGNPIAKDNAGKDLVMQEGKTYVFINDYRLYHLVKLPSREIENQLEIILQDPGIEIFRLGSE